MRIKKNAVTIDTGHNEVWEVERVYPLERASYWWTKPQLKQIREDYKNEVMMEGVKNLVKTRVEQEEVDTRIIDERVEEIMQLDPGSIANFLQSIPKKLEKLSTNFNAMLDSSNDSNSLSNRDSISETDSDSDTDPDSDSESSSSGSENEEQMDNTALRETKITFEKTMKLNNNWDDESKLQYTSNDDNDLPSCSSSSQCKVLALSKDSLTPSQSHKDEMKMKIVKTETHSDCTSPSCVDIQSLHETLNSSTSNKPTLNKDKILHSYKQISNREVQCNLQPEKKKSGKSRFKQGVLALLAMDRLERIVKRKSSPPFGVYDMLLSDDQLLDMHLPSYNEDVVDYLGDQENDCENISCKDLSECPICLHVVDPKQRRKIKLLRRMLCKECFFSYYINHGGNCRYIDDNERVSRPISAERIRNDDELTLKIVNGVQILNSLNQYISSTKKSPIQPELPNSKMKSSMLTDEIYVRTRERNRRNTKVTTVRRNKSSTTKIKSEKSRPKR
mmetsp:Transcript_18347/g.42305  ORF Transcript_18347/g.42305 Transcript_18347/m.42305 type:complete len:504 (-) Transcript_18347:297-1808(-)